MDSGQRSFRSWPQLVARLAGIKRFPCRRCALALSKLLLTCLKSLVQTLLVVANGRIAARYHIGFPVVARASWGMWGSYMAVIMRCAAQFYISLLLS